MKMTVFWLLCHVVWQKLTVVSEELTASIIKVMIILTTDAGHFQSFN
jgi:hypothetical protein